MKLSIAASYWIVNKAGIPLIFKQESVQQEAAGLLNYIHMIIIVSVVEMVFNNNL